MTGSRDLNGLETAADIAQAVRERSVSASAIIERALERIGRCDPGLNAFTAVFAEQARADAAYLDQQLTAGHAAGPLCGVPFAVKNLFDVAGETTIAGSRIDAWRAPASRDATLVKRLRDAGAILVGALNMDEYAYGFTTENAHYGPTRNPHDPARVAGGSSGGSAAAVAAGMAPISLGSDTNGSIRVPAALCGVFGLKPTFGGLSRTGVRPFVHSLDHAGPLARTARDLALAYDMMVGHDPADPASIARDYCRATPLLEGDATPLRVGRLQGWFDRGADVQCAAAANRVAKALGAAPTILKGAERARAAAFCITAAEGGSLHLDALRAWPDAFDPAVRDRLIAGAMLPSFVVTRAQRFRRQFLTEALAAFSSFDVLVAPATPLPATPVGQAEITLNGRTVSARATLGLYAQPISFVGLPVVTVPLVTPGALPVGVQLIGPPWSEARLLALAHRLESDGIVGAGPFPSDPDPAA